MAVVTREDVQALREEVQQYRERVARLEVQIGESDKRLATKEDVEKAIGAVLLEVSKLETKMFRLLLSLGVPLLLGMLATLYRLFM